MKELLAVISLLVLEAVAEAPAPYPPSGWRPSGPSFELPQQGSRQQPQNQYLPALDPRNPGTEEDVSVQGLPQTEQRPLFQGSPIAGQQYAGPNFNQDLRNLDKSFQQSQYEQQQERYREYERQRQLEAQSTPSRLAPSSSTPSRSAPTNPRQFARPTEATTNKVTSTTEDTLNQGEVEEKTSVEVTKQDVKEIPGEFFLSSLAQLQLQPQFVQLQSVSGRYIQPQSSAYSQPEKQTGFDGPAHFSALPSVLAQQNQKALAKQQLDQGFLVQNEQPLLVQQPFSQFAQAQVQTYQPQAQYQPDSVVLQALAQFQPNVYIQPNPDAVAVQPTSQYAPVQPATQYAPVNYQPVVQPQFVAQPVAFEPQQPQPNFAQQPRQQPEDDEKEQDEQNQQTQKTQNQQQFYQQPIVVQPFPAQLNQGQFYQPQNQYDQAQFAQPQNQFVQPGQPQTQFVQPGQLQTQFIQPGQPQTQFVQPGQPQTQFLQPQDLQNQYAQAAAQNQYAQPQAQYAQPQMQFVRPQQTQPEVQYLRPENTDSQSQYRQPQLAQGQFPQPQSNDLQNQYLQPQFTQGQFLQPQLADPQTQYLQPQFAQPQLQFGQPQFQGEGNLQSGLDINQEGNDIDDPEDKEDGGATAVATAFGTRTQPRVNTRYGAPFPVPKVQANPGTTTESAVEDITEEGPAVAQAVAVANGERRKSARLRGRRIRPVYAVDRSGRLVLAEA